MIDEIDLLKALLSYDPETGIFTWTKDIGHCVKVGQIAGNLSVKGYWKFQLAGKIYLAHRVAFLFMKGRWPRIIDHKDGDRQNNRWSNLREVTSSQSVTNSVRNVGASGLRGVNFNPKLSKWLVRIGYEGQRTYVGSYDTKEEAERAYLIASNDIHGEYAVHNRPSTEH